MTYLKAPTHIIVKSVTRRYLNVVFQQIPCFKVRIQSHARIMCTVIIVNPNGSNLADSYLFLYLDIIFIAFSG